MKLFMIEDFLPQWDGYKPVGVVEARNEDEALARYLITLIGGCKHPLHPRAVEVCRCDCNTPSR